MRDSIAARAPGWEAEVVWAVDDVVLGRDSIGDNTGRASTTWIDVGAVLTGTGSGATTLRGNAVKDTSDCAASRRRG